MTPSELSEKLMQESAEYSQVCDGLSDILKVKAVKWMEIRERCTSDKQADQRWDATVDGLSEISCRFKLKALDKSMSAIKTRLRIIEGEARNLY